MTVTVHATLWAQSRMGQPDPDGALTLVIHAGAEDGGAAALLRHLGADDPAALIARAEAHICGPEWLEIDLPAHGPASLRVVEAPSSMQQLEPSPAPEQTQTAPAPAPVEAPG